MYLKVLSIIYGYIFIIMYILILKGQTNAIYWVILNNFSFVKKTYHRGFRCPLA